MDDLISRQAVLNELPHALWWKESDEALAKAIIESVPTIDPVKHGKWLNTSTDIPNLLMNVCSECGFQYPSAIRPRFNYCPNCGARMDL